jgi:hypothetical protein
MGYCLCCQTVVAEDAQVFREDIGLRTVCLLIGGCFSMAFALGVKRTSRRPSRRFVELRIVSSIKGAASLPTRQFFNRYPVLKIQEMTTRHAARNPRVIKKLVTTLTSAVP